MMSYREFRLRCPYGLWTCADGREVIFNREYWPILERRPGEKAKPANPNEWIGGIKERDYFFDDANPPWDRRRRRAAADTLARCNRILAAWDFPILSKPPPPTALSDLRGQPRVNPYGGAWPASDSRYLAFLDKPPTHCCDCGALLTREEVACDRDLCFECYCFHQE